MGDVGMRVVGALWLAAAVGFGVAATGVVAVVLWKVLLVFLLPLIGIAVGFAFLVAKVVFIVVMVCVAIWLFRRLGLSEQKSA